MTEEPLARRCRALLAFYPRWFRVERGDELIGTLLEAARPGQVRPTWRETRSLVLEGLRMRAGLRTAGATLVGAVRLAVLVALAMWTLGAGAQVLDGGPVAAEVAVVAYGLVPFVLVALGRVRPAVPFTAVGGLAGALLSTLFRGADAVSSYHLPMFSVVALAGLAVLWHRPAARTRVGAAGLAFAALPPLLLWVPAWLPLDGPIAPDDVLLYGQALPVALLYLGALGSVVVDPRPALAVATFLVLFAVQVVAILAPAGVSPAGVAGPLLAVVLGAAAVAVVAAGLGLRRQVAAVTAKVGG